MTMALGTRRVLPREENDFYRTPPEVTQALLLKESLTDDVWEPSCGDGAISKVLAAAGHRVFSTGLIERGFGVSGCDFLKARETFPYDIVTNPPFKLADQFVMHARSLGARKVVMLLRLTWLEGEKRRRTVFEHAAPSRVWVLSRRPTLWNGADPNARTNGGAISYAWFVWDRGAEPGCRLGWIGQHELRDREARELEDLCA